MSNIVIADNGKIRKVEHIELAEKVIEMRNQKDPWKVIAKLVEGWTKTAPDEVQAILINVDEYKEMTQDKKFGTTLGGKDQERRFKLAFPANLQLMIRTQYKADELPFDQKFYAEFGKRYPAFKVAEKN